MVSMTSQVQSGKLKAIAVGGIKRSPTMPDIPTVAESGVPTYQSFGWFGLMAPAKTPKAILQKLHQATVTAVGSAEIAQKFMQLGVDPVTNSPEEFGKFVADQLVRYKSAVKELGIQAD
jgi:tripartite-type tricarboxylate transporter receptor subunit TctC